MTYCSKVATGKVTHMQFLEETLRSTSWFKVDGPFGTIYRGSGKEGRDSCVRWQLVRLNGRQFSDLADQAIYHNNQIISSY